MSNSLKSIIKKEEEIIFFSYLNRLKNSRIIPILPDNYKDNTWIRSREGMSNLSVNKVFEFICDKEVK